MTYEEKPATGSNNVYFGIEWSESNAATTFSIKPTIYRWDRQNTDNSGGRWSEDITKTSGSGTDSWSGLSFVAGSGYRTIDTFSKRTYTKGTSAKTITYHLYTDSSFGTYYNGWTNLGAQTWTFTMTIPALASYTVSYNANGGSGTVSNQTKYYGTNLTLRSNSYTKSGYTFKEWNTKSDGTGTKYAAGATYTGNAALSLYAIWTPNTYSVTYNANGGSGTTAAQTKTHGVALTLRSNSFTRTNYVFKNWNTNSGGTGTSYSAGASYTGNAALSLYAQWYAPYTVAYNANGGSGAPSSQTKVHNTSLTLSSTRPTRTGYNFLRWNTVSGGTGTNYNPGATYTANAAATLYAQWEVAHYAPTISSLSVQRCDSNGTLNAEGVCCKVTCAWSVDNTTAGYTSTTGSKMKVKVDSYSEVQVNISGTSGTTEYVYSANSLSVGSTHSVNVTIVDTASANNSTSRSAIVTRAFFTIHFKDGGTGIGIGKPSTEDNLLDVGMPANFDGNVTAGQVLYRKSSNVSNASTATSSNTSITSYIERDGGGTQVGYSETIRTSTGLYRSFAVTNPKSSITSAMYLHALDDGTRSISFTSGLVVPVANGGTGITSNPSMLVNLASTTAADVFAASPRPGVTGTLPVARGGTGVAYGFTWQQIKKWSGTAQQSWSMGSYSEFLIVARYSTSFLGSALLPAEHITSTAREVYVSGGYNGAGVQGRGFALTLSSTTAKAKIATADGTDRSSSTSWWIYGR